MLGDLAEKRKVGGQVETVPVFLRTNEDKLAHLRCGVGRMSPTLSRIAPVT